jgi:hypothetical protein
LRLSRHGGFDALDPCRIGIDRIVEREWTVEDAANDLTTVRHLAERRRLNGRRDLRRHRLNGGEDRDPGRAEADLRKHIDRVLNDIALGVEIGEDIDGGVRDEKGFVVSRHVHDENVADPPRGAQSGSRCGHGPHKLVGVQTALHQQLALPLVDQFDRLCRGFIAMGDIDDLEFSYVEFVVASDSGDLRCRSNENWDDDSGLGRLDRTTKRCLVARVDHDRRRRRGALCLGD